MSESEVPETLSDNEEENQGPLDMGAVVLAEPAPAARPDELAEASLTADEDLVCGVDRELIEKFLALVRDNYKKADEATFFLEQRSGVMNVPSMANMRDVLSHLVTLLNPETPNDRRIEQLATSEEHLRRAILEPYEIALNELTLKFEALYENEYKKRLLPIMHKHTVLKGAPNTVSIEASLRQINILSSEGRAGKSRNLWNPEWEKAVAAYISAFDQLDSLFVSMETHWHNYEQIRRDKKSGLLHFGGYALAIILFLLVILFPSVPDRLRILLHLQKAQVETQIQK